MIVKDIKLNLFNISIYCITKIIKIKGGRVVLSIYGTKVKKRLIEIGMTQKELSKQLGISQENLSIILSGRRSGWKHRDRIDEILKNTKSRRIV